MIVQTRLQLRIAGQRGRTFRFMVARNEMAPRLAFQITPPVGSGVSMPIASFPSSARAFQIARTAWSGSFFVVYQHNSDPASLKEPFRLSRHGCVDHCRQAAFHVG